MKLLEILERGAIEPALSASDKLGVLRELSAIASRVDDGIDTDQLTEILLERERLGSTGIGHGVAIPHGKTQYVGKTLVVFARSTPGVEFDARDEAPCHLFFMLAAPDPSPANLHLKALARISRLLTNIEFRDNLMKAPDADSLWEAIRLEDERI